jgi:hypothetical protein
LQFTIFLPTRIGAIPRNIEKIGENLNKDKMQPLLAGLTESMSRGECKGQGKKKGELYRITPTCSPSFRASRSLLRIMKEAFRGTTLHHWMGAIGSTQQPGFHHSQKGERLRLKAVQSL